MLKKKYSYGKQFIDEDDIQAVTKVMRSSWLTQGPMIEKFEQSLCDKFGFKYGTAVANGTAALHLASICLGCLKGDVVITSPLTFLATANSIIYTGSIPDFVDIDPISYTIDINKLEEKIKFYHKKGINIKGVIGVDYAGHPCDWENLRYLANKHEFHLIDDACHAIGAGYNNSIKYASKFADITIFSFHPVKHITTGEGGALMTNLELYNKRANRLRAHGITKDTSEMERQVGPWYYEMHELGFNFRLTDIQCALGISQMKKLDNFIKKRQNIALSYNKHLYNENIFTIPEIKKGVSHSYHLYPLQIKFDKIETTKKELFNKLMEQNIYCQVHYIPIHLQPYYKKNYGFKYGDFPVAEKFYKQEISIPMYPSLEIEDIDYIVSIIKKITK